MIHVNSIYCLISRYYFIHRHIYTSTLYITVYSMFIDWCKIQIGIQCSCENHYRLSLECIMYIYIYIFMYISQIFIQYHTVTYRKDSKRYIAICLHLLIIFEHKIYQLYQIIAFHIVFYMIHIDNMYIYIYTQIYHYRLAFPKCPLATYC